MDFPKKNLRKTVIETRAVRVSVNAKVVYVRWLVFERVTSNSLPHLKLQDPLVALPNPPAAPPRLTSFAT